MSRVRVVEVEVKFVVHVDVLISEVAVALLARLRFEAREEALDLFQVFIAARRSVPGRVSLREEVAAHAGEGGD